MSWFLALNQRSEGSLWSQAKFAECFPVSPLFAQLISLVLLPCRLGRPNPTAHFCPPGEGRHSTTAVAARSISKCSHDFWVHPTPPVGPRGTWRCSRVPFGSWRLSIYNNKGMKVSPAIPLCPPKSILLTTETKYTNHVQIRRWIFLGLLLFAVILLLLLSCTMNGLIF